MDYPRIVSESGEDLRPSRLCRYLLDLSQALNNYYHEVPVLKAEEKVRDARLVLISCVKSVLASGLSLIGIAAPEEM
jgi:arginyl-tRNA synthetase